MARAKVTKTTTTRRKKMAPGKMPCNICHGTGQVNKPKRKKG